MNSTTYSDNVTITAPAADAIIAAMRSLPTRPPAVTPSAIARPGQPVVFVGRLLVHPDDIARVLAAARHTSAGSLTIIQPRLPGG